MTLSRQVSGEQQSSSTGGLFTEIVRLALIAIAYFIAVRVGLLFTVQPEGIACIWPPSGVALAALLLSERRKWVPILLVIFVTNTVGNVTGGNSLPVSLGFALANIIEPAAGACVLVHFFGPKITFTRVAEVLALCGVAALSNGLTALFGAAVPTIAFGVSFFDTWFVWWVSDGLGIILVTPIIITWATSPNVLQALPARRVVEGAILLAMMLALTWLIFGFFTTAEHPFLHIYMVFPLLIWAALRFSPRGTATMILVFAVIVLWNTAHGYNVFGFADQQLKKSVLLVQVLLIVATLSGLILAAVVTERKLAEEALRGSEEKYRGLYDSIRDAILVTDTNRTIIACNPAFTDLFGYSLDEIRGEKTICIYESEKHFQELGKALKEHYGESPFLKTVNYKKKNGEVFPGETGVFYLKDQRGDVIGFIGLIRDVTERKRFEDEKAKLEAKLRQAHKMEAIGTLAGGIAHDFNNMLGIILGNTELAMDDVPEWNPAHLNLEEVKTASLRAKDVVRQLLSFARKTEQERKPTNIISITKESMNLLRSSIPTSIEIRQNIPKNVATILADPTQINQVMINLCTNAAHAMEKDDGILEISLENVILDESLAQSYEVNPGRYVKLSVSDTGHGIGPEIKDRIFDPYFTTREVGKGSGMGLAVVHGIVMNHNGAITVDSEVGKGTTFNVFLPIVEREPVPEIKIDEDLPTGKERILFVDDEESIVKMGSQRLERLGYKVESTTSSVEALAIFRSKPDQFDLVISDLTMPKMTGDKMVKEILDIRPDMPIIICTGFSEKMNGEKATALGASGYLEKPHEKRDLAQMVRKVLDGKAG